MDYTILTGLYDEYFECLMQINIMINIQKETYWYVDCDGLFWLVGERYLFMATAEQAYVWLKSAQARAKKY
jgi:hypothetical protein